MGGLCTGTTTAVVCISIGGTLLRRAGTGLSTDAAGLFGSGCCSPGALPGVVARPIAKQKMNSAAQRSAALTIPRRFSPTGPLPVKIRCLAIRKVFMKTGTPLA
jgi:hypothetical protein